MKLKLDELLIEEESKRVELERKSKLNTPERNQIVNKDALFQTINENSIPVSKKLKKLS